MASVNSRDSAIVLVHLVATLVMLAPASAQVTITDLGTLPGGSYSTALDVNDAGQVVGVSNSSVGAYRGFLWQNATMTELPPLPGGTNSSANRINNRGQIFGTSDTPQGFSHAVTWRNGVAVDLGIAPGFGFVTPNSVNDSPQVVGESELAANGQSHAFVWENGVMLDLGSGVAFANNAAGQVTGMRTYANTLPHGFRWDDGEITDLGTLGGSYSLGFAINNRGAVVGDSDVASGQKHAFMWTDGTMQDLGVLWTGGISRAVAVNDSAQAAGFATTSTGQYAAVFWDKGTIVHIGGLEPGRYSEALAINNHGQVLGISATAASPHFFIWERGHMTDLGVLPGARTIDFYIPPALNERGQVAGQSATASGDIHAVLWTLAGPPLRVTTPNSPARWGIGTTQRVSWSYEGSATQFAIAIDRGTGSWDPIAVVDNRPGRSQTFAWTVTRPASRVRLRVAVVDTDAASDMNDADITIEPPTIAIIGPEITAVRFGSSQTIVITHDLGAGAPVAIDVSGDDGRTWRTVAERRTTGSTTASFQGVVDLAPTTHGRLRVRALDGSGASAISNRFTVLPAAPGPAR